MRRLPYLACVFSARCAFSAALTGCTYYKITDPQTGRTFYAQDNLIMGVPRVVRHGPPFRGIMRPAARKTEDSVDETAAVEGLPNLYQSVVGSVGIRRMDRVGGVKDVIPRIWCDSRGMSEDQLSPVFIPAIVIWLAGGVPIRVGQRFPVNPNEIGGMRHAIGILRRIVKANPQVWICGKCLLYPRLFR